MQFKNMKLLNDVVLDYDNPDKIYKLAREYDKLEQGAAAAGFYLRAADMSEGKTFEEKWLQYKCMILQAFIYERNENRNISVLGFLEMAIETLPDRPEAYYFISDLYERRNQWRNSLVYSKIGIQCYENKEIDSIDNDVNYPGLEALKFLYAKAKWKTDGRDESKNLLFDLKYKHKLDKNLELEVDNYLNQVRYPSTLPFTPDLLERYKFPFDGIENVESNYSRHFQDMFVLSVTNGKRNGTFVEIGSGHPKLFNNTLLLEKEFGWKGLSIDISERMCHQHSRMRSTGVMIADANNLDYNELFNSHCFENKIDFLRINAEHASLNTLQKMPFNKFEFGIIQFQHNNCWWNNNFREESRKILKDIGYILIVPDVAVDHSSNYEDWWIHPMYVQNARTMKGKDGINFAWDYMMEKL